MSDYASAEGGPTSMSGSAQGDLCLTFMSASDEGVLCLTTMSGSAEVGQHP